MSLRVQVSPPLGSHEGVPSDDPARGGADSAPAGFRRELGVSAPQPPAEGQKQKSATGSGDLPLRARTGGEALTCSWAEGLE